jgi:hypothetical protein
MVLQLDCGRVGRCQAFLFCSVCGLVVTARHREGFSLWDSKANPYNSAKLGPKRSIVREFVKTCS